MKKNKVQMPILRFKDEQGNEYPDWRWIKFEDAFTFRPTNSFSRENLNYTEGDVLNIHYGDIHTTFASHFHLKREPVPFVNPEIDISRTPQDNYCQEGDLVIADASEDYDDVGKSIEILDLSSEKVLAGLHTILARPNANIFFKGFSGHLMQSESVRLQIKVIAQGTKVLSISASRLGTILLNIPTLAEQEKIASFLSSIDRKIENLEKELEALRDYKKGVMQAIFAFDAEAASSEQRAASSEQRLKIKAAQGTTLSAFAVRFRDGEGEEFPEWEEKKLGEVCEISIGLCKDQNDFRKGYRVTRIETISDGEINEDKVGFVDTEDNIELYRLKLGDILFSNINSVSHIGKTAIVKDNLDLYHGMNLLRLQCKKGIVPLFVFYVLNTVKLRVFFKTICNQAVSQASINQTELSKTSICVPSVSEQQKIAQFLSAVDEKINLVAQQIAQTEVWKKGLMQRMFV